MLSAGLHPAADATVPWSSLRASLHELEGLTSDDPRRDGSHALES